MRLCNPVYYITCKILILRFFNSASQKVFPTVYFYHLLKLFFHLWTGSSVVVKADVPFFRCNAILSIPNIVMSPGLDEVQMTLNRTVQMILSVFRSVSLWDNGLQRSKQFHSEGALSVVGTEPNTERRGSVTSNAPSEISRVDLGELTYYPASFILSAHFWCKCDCWL